MLESEDKSSFHRDPPNWAFIYVYLRKVWCAFQQHIHEQSLCSLKFAAVAHRIPNLESVLASRGDRLPRFWSWDAIFWTLVSKDTHFVFTALQMKCTFIYHHSSIYHDERARLERSSFPHQLQFSKDLAAIDSGVEIVEKWPLEVNFDLYVTFSRAKNWF